MYILKLQFQGYIFWIVEYGKNYVNKSARLWYDLTRKMLISHFKTYEDKTV